MNSRLNYQSGQSNIINQYNEPQSNQNAIIYQNARQKP